MFLQPLITIPVIDSGLRFSQCAEMLTHDEIKAELIRQIDAGKITQAAVARHLSIAPARINEIIRSGKRRIQPDEMPKLAELLGMAKQDAVNKVESISLVPVLGRVAQGVWMEQSDTDSADGDFVVYDRLGGDAPPTDLFAVIPEGNSMNRRFMSGTHLICRRVPFGSGEYKSGSYVIVERTAHDLTELTVKRLEIDSGGIHWLHSESDDERFQEPWRIGKPDENHFDDREIRVIGRVVRAVQDLDNG